MSAVSASLSLRVKRPLREIPESDWALLKNEAAAVRYCINNSGLQEKSLAIEIGTDPATLSKAKAGQARLNCEALDALMDASGFEAPMFATLLRRGYDPRVLHRLENDLERRLREAEQRIQQLETEREIEMRTMRSLLTRAA